MLRQTYGLPDLRPPCIQSFRLRPRQRHGRMHPRHDHAPAHMRRARLARVRALLAAALCLLLILIYVPAHAGTWTQLTHSPPSSPGGMLLLLTDGSVLVQSGSGTGWNRLTPDIHGSYLNGTWTTLASMHDSRLYNASQVLRDGRVFIAGGEYGTGGNTAEVFDPVTNDWTVAPFQGQRYSDAISEILGDGRVLVAPSSPLITFGTYIYDPASNTWSAGPMTLRGQGEVSWLKLPDGSILSVDGVNQSERYIPALNQWVADAGLPSDMFSGGETGCGHMLANGTALYRGYTHTAIYTPSGTSSPGTWTAGPDIPGGLNCGDAPGAVMTNGNVFFTAGPGHLTGPTSFFEYDATAGTFSQVDGPTGTTYNKVPFDMRMLCLPDGTVLVNVGGKLYEYVSATGSPVTAFQPAISSISHNADGSCHLTGTNLNGFSEGAAYGDDFQMVTNYPIARLTDGSGNVYYARTYGWSSTAVQTGASTQSTEFTLPLGLPAGTYSAAVVTNGIASAPVSLTTPYSAGDAAPTVATAAAATPGSTAGTTTALSVLGADSDGGGEPALTYTWTTTTAPSGASTPSFSINGTHAAKNTTATFHHAGTYTFTATLTDASGLSATSSVSITVSQTLTSATVTPTTAVLTASGQTQQLTAYGLDQFGVSMTSQPGFTWGMVSGYGSVSSSGLYTAPARSTLATVSATTGALSATVAINVLIDGLQAAYKFDEGSGTTSADTTGDGYTCTLAGAAWTTGIAGSGALSFAGNNSSTASIPTMNLNTDTLTLTCWVKRNGAQVSNAGIIFCRTSSTGSGLFFTSTGGLRYNWNSASYAYAFNSGLTVPDSQWTFIAVVVTPTSATLYMQPLGSGMQTATNNVAHDVEAFDGVITFGQDTSYTTRCYNGALDEVHIYNTALDSTQITALAAYGTSPTVATAASAAPATVTGVSTALSVLGASTVYAESALTYTWAATTLPGGASVPTFSASGTHAAQSSTATFTQAGSYTLTATITDPGGSTVTSSVPVTVSQTLTSVTVSPPAGYLSSGQMKQLTATGYDQFGVALTAQPTFTWAVVSGGGSVSSSGLYTAPATATQASISATTGALSATAMLNDITGLQATYKFDEGSGATSADTTGDGYTCTLSGATWTTGLEGTGALSFAGSNTTTATIPAMNLNTNTLTISGWIKSSGTQIANAGVIFCRAGTTASGLFISGGNGLRYNWNSTSASYNFNPGLTVPDSQWTFIALVVTPTAATVYMQPLGEAMQSATNTATHVVEAFDGVITFGQDTSYTTRCYTGALDEVRIYNTALNATQIAALAAATPTVATAAAASSSTVVGNSTSLSVLGTSNVFDESALTYTWAATTLPGEASAPSFSANGTHAAQSSAATFTHAGSYTLTATIADPGGGTATSSVPVTVNQTLTSITLAAGTPVIGAQITQQFTATGWDQFGGALTAQPTFTWAATGYGSVSSSGLYTAPYASGTASITASSGGHTSPASSVTASTPWKTWLTTAFTTTQAADPAISGPLSNPTHDGICNLLKYALNASPTAPTSGLLPVLAVDTTAGTLTFTYRQNAAATDLTYVIQQSTDLTNWSTATPTTTIQLSDDGQTRVQQATLPLGSATQLMLRLRVLTP